MSSKRRKSAPSKVCPSPDSSPVAPDSIQAEFKLDKDAEMLSNYIDHHLGNLEGTDIEMDEQDNLGSLSELETELSEQFERHSSNGLPSVDRFRPLHEVLDSYKLKCKSIECPPTKEHVEKSTIILAQKRLDQIIEQLDKLRQRFMDPTNVTWEVSFPSLALRFWGLPIFR